jgi:hypothetical protein
MRLSILFGASIVALSCATSSNKGAASFDTRLPAMEAVVQSAKAQPWGSELKQIPATVIDVGDLTNVPYMSFAGKDVELNVYGDPAHPAGLEIGTKSDSAELRAQLRTFISQLLKGGDAEKVKAVEEGKKEDSDGLALEVTKPDAPDAYGAWWVTATHPVGLNGARASVGEIGELSSEPRMDFSDSPAFPDVGATPNFFSYTRYRPIGKRVYTTSYYRKDGVYYRRK